MDSYIKILKGKKEEKTIPEFFNENNFNKVYEYHRTIKEYEKTPLVSLASLAKSLNVKGIYVKDESKRFGLNAFKGLGASYAINNIINENKNKKDFTFVTATDGNHGKGVAWASMKNNAESIIFMPKGSSKDRVNAIEKIKGSKVYVTEYNYDDAVRYADKYAKENGFYLVQDTAFDGYEDVPIDIILGYTTMVREALQEIKEKPTHVFLQAGVGSMASSVIGYLNKYYNEDMPNITVIEAEEASCIYNSVKNGKLTPVGGNPKTIMAGLNCGEVNPLVWNLLKNNVDFYASCPDWVTEIGMIRAAYPFGEDEKIIAGESGAVGLGLLLALMNEDKYKAWRDDMGINKNSVFLFFNTEGDTDKESYQMITEEEG